MADKLSRRALVRGVAAAAAVTVVPGVRAQERQPEPPGLDAHLDELEKKLAHPLAPAVKKLAREQLKNLEKESADRLKFKLPENSEPCAVFLPTGVKPKEPREFR